MNPQKLGQTIKFFRQHNQMKQDALAIGICTTSYLSRIENGLVQADETIYHFFAEYSYSRNVVSREGMNANPIILLVLIC